MREAAFVRMSFARGRRERTGDTPKDKCESAGEVAVVDVRWHAWQVREWELHNWGCVSTRRRSCVKQRPAGLTCYTLIE